jgi:hypothetical protein
MSATMFLKTGAPVHINRGSFLFIDPMELGESRKVLSSNRN